MRRLLPLAFIVAACAKHDTPVEPSPVKNVTITLTTNSIVVGSTTQATAKITDVDGVVIPDRVPTWSSQTPSVISVTSNGLITGLQPGTGVVRAAAGSVIQDAQILVTNPQASEINLTRDTATVFLPGGAVQLIAIVKDAAGNPITTPAIFWQSLSPLIATVNAQGLVTALAVGTATVRATIDGKQAQTVVTVLATPNASAPLIVAVNPATLRPGGTFTVVGNNFGATPAANAVVVDGVPVTVTAATTTAMSITLPTAGFACDPTHTVFVQVTVGGLVGGGPAPLRAANVRTLLPGQSVVVSNQAEVRCTELPQTGGRYLISVYNASRATVSQGNTASATVNLRGAAGTALATSALVPPAAVAVPRIAPRPATTAPRMAPSTATPVPLIVPRLGGETFGLEMLLAREREDAHRRILERNIEYARSASFGFGGAGIARARAPDRPNTQLTTLGSITQLKIPNLDASNFCASSIPVGVRTVFVGAHSIIVEDTLSTFAGKQTLQGQLNNLYTQLGQEFEDVMWPILTTKFGNPLVLDAQLSGTGKVVMLFSPRVNGLQAGRIQGFVVTCDFQTVAQSPSSNVGEFFYANVPTSTIPSFGDPESKESWLRNIRATVIHEVKHITAFGERLSRSTQIEDLSWEEGMARNVEEMYARTFYGTQQLQNTTYAASVGCDLKFAQPTAPCANRPLLMLRHFDALYFYLAAPDAFTPLGRVTGSDLTYYASTWAFQRWAADHFGTSEAQFFKDLTTASTNGVVNLEARTGRPWEEMLGEWSLALAVDDRPSFTSENPRLRFPSWNLRDVFAGLCGDLGPCLSPSTQPQFYPRAIPLQPRALTFGAFAVNTNAITGGSFTTFELSGTQTGTQVIEIRSLTGVDAAPTIRLAIVRLE